MARPDPLADNVLKAKTLKALVAGQEVSYAHKQRLIQMGLVDNSNKVLTDAIKSAGRGRKKIEYTLTTRGKSLLNLPRSWKAMKDENVGA